MMTPAQLATLSEMMQSSAAAILDGVTFVDYSTITALSWTHLKEMRRSPLHYKHRATTPIADATHLMMGRAVHTAVLEPDRFALEYAVFDGGARRGKAWLAFKDAHQTRTLLKASEYERCLRIRDAVRAHPIARGYLAHGKPERSVLWIDSTTGLPCKGRVDWTCDDMPVFLDLKTTVDLDMRRFGGVAARLGYQCQLAWYKRGLARAEKAERDAKMIVVEPEPPFDVAVFSVDPELLYAGAEECDELATRVRKCLDTNTWSGRYTRESPLELPAWWYAQDGEAELGAVHGTTSDDNDVHHGFGG